MLWFQYVSSNKQASEKREIYIYIYYCETGSNIKDCQSCKSRFTKYKNISM